MICLIHILKLIKCSNLNCWYPAMSEMAAYCAKSENDHTDTLWDRMYIWNMLICIAFFLLLEIPALGPRTILVLYINLFRQTDCIACPYDKPRVGVNNIVLVKSLLMDSYFCHGFSWVANHTRGHSQAMLENCSQVTNILTNVSC